MPLPRWIQKSLVLPAGAAMLMVFAGSAEAQSQRELFSWSGSVDREVHITMRGRIARVQGGEWSGEDRGRTEVVNALPQANGSVGVRVEDGRGDVDVIQQPSVRNDYTTVIRIRDESGGADRYHVRALWFGDDDREGRDGYGRGRINDGRGGRIGDRDDPWSGPGRGNDARNAMFWTGSVDGVLEIRLRGDRVEYRTISGRTVRDVRVEMPRRGILRPNMPLRVQWAEGRGTVRVVQQPTPRNGHTTVIRINDPQGGYGRYAFELIPNRFAAARF